jgi:hypothetical protein
MKVVLVCFVAFLATRSPAQVVETLRPEQLRPGMKGYGLSVFKGTTPERFDVEVMGVLKNVFPKQDMILIRASGADLEKHKVIAGMSGSPIYIDGKLIGALSYGWAFENEAVAGVTPIHNMLVELNQPMAPRASVPAPTRADRRWLQPPTLFTTDVASDTPAAKPLLTPLSLGGFSPRLIELMAEKFARFGLIPMAIGGGSIDPTRRVPPLEAGGSIGVDLIRGDLCATGVGTVTYVDQNRILAFGHPFFQSGQVEAPAVHAEVHGILSSMSRSFKMAAGIGEIGSLIGDWQSCIVADTKVKARMIPVSVEVRNRDTTHHQNYQMEVFENQLFAPLLVQMAIAQTVFSASASSQETTIRATVNTELPDRILTVSDTFYNSMGGLLDPGALDSLSAVFNSPFGHPEVKRIDVTIEAVLSRETAQIKRAYFNKSQVERGETAALTVVLKPYGQEEVTRVLPIEVPAIGDSMRQLSVTVSAGSTAPQDTALPESLDDYLNAIQKRHRSTDLVALIQSSGQGLQYHGRLLKKLPASIASVLDDPSSSDVASAADTQQIVVPTEWVLAGQATVRVPIRQE